MDHTAHTGDPNSRPQHPLANYQFSSDELRILRECNLESFYQRSLPLGTALGLAAYFGVKQGYLTPNIRYGAVPKVMVGVLLGYFVGKFSYQQRCAEKIMLLPNSRLGELLRQRQNQSGFSSLKTDSQLGVGMTLSPFASNAGDIYSDEHLQPAGKGNALNLDMENRPTYAGLDDTYRPTLDSAAQIDPDIPLEPVKPGMTYEELRQRNREEYEKKQQNPLSSPLPSNAPLVVREPKTTPPEDPVKRVRTNKYGDPLE
uniref:OCIA domain-containing protein n=1 Tax=Glossina pallidipes TaxID=7398 RepID=A0A1B0A9I3_GLOPL